MPEFTDLKEAFTWWLENEYSKLDSTDKKILKNLRNNFVNHNQAVSDVKLLETLNKYGKVKILFIPESK